MRFLSLTLILSLLSVLTACNKSGKENTPVETKTGIPYVIMLSMDGFRWNYPDRTSTPAFDEMAQKGIRAEMVSSFPTKTFPNHYTIATGLYPDHHGLVNNTFWDPQRGVLYKISDRSKVQDGYFYGGEPIWVTAEKQHVRSASYFGGGSEAKIDGYYPSIRKTYEHAFPFYQRADSVIAWLQLPHQKRPHLILWYVSEPDGTGHHAGPESQQITDTIAGLDRLLAYFLNEIEKLDIKDSINLIVLSDHGMQEISSQRVIRLQDYLKPGWTKGINGGNPVYNIWVTDGYKDSVRRALQNVAHLQLYDKDNIPPRLHYMTNERCGDFVTVADSAWSLFNDYVPTFTTGGTHGYDNANRNMDAIFYAFGPDFKSQSSENTRLNNVDVYNLLCKILDLEAAKNDGDASRVHDFVK